MAAYVMVLKLSFTGSANDLCENVKNEENRGVWNDS